MHTSIDWAKKRQANATYHCSLAAKAFVFSCEVLTVKEIVVNSMHASTTLQTMHLLPSQSMQANLGKLNGWAVAFGQGKHLDSFLDISQLQ